MSTTTSADLAAPIQVLRLRQVCERTGLCRSIIYQLEQEQRFPSRIKLTTHSVGWIEEEIQQWLAARIELSRSGVRKPAR